VLHRGKCCLSWPFKPINDHAQSANFQIREVRAFFPISQSQTRDFSASRL